MREDLDVQSEVRLKGALVSPPEFDHTDKGQPRCRLVFPKKCTGKGDLNKKPYWLQVVTFGELAIQSSKIPVGSIVAVICRINANRWLAKDGVTVKSSQNYIGFKVGVVKSLTDSPEWLPGAPKKAKKAAESREAVEEIEGGDEGEEFALGEPEDFNSVNAFLHPESRQAATSTPGSDTVPGAAAEAEVQGTEASAGSVPGELGGH